MEQVERIQVIQCHDGDVNSCDFGAKDRLATASSDHMVRIWNWSKKNQKFVEDVKSPLKHHSYAVNEVRFSPQGTMLATGSTDGSAAIWDLATCTVLCTFVQPSRLGVRCCRFSPDSSMLLTSGDDDSACMWNISSRSLIKELRQAEHTVFCSEFTPDSRNLITTDANGDLRLWDTVSNHAKPLYVTEEAHDLGVLCCEFAPWNHLSGDDGSSLDRKFVLATGGNDDCVKLWTVVIGLNTKIQSRKKMSGCHSSAVMCVRFSKDGQYLASCGGDKLVCIYDANTGTLVKMLEPHDRYIGSCAFSWSGAFFVTGSNDKTLSVFRWMDCNDNNEPASNECNDEDDHRLSALVGRQDALLLRNVSKGHRSDINDVIFTSDQNLVTCSSDKLVKVWSNVKALDGDLQSFILDEREYAIYSMDVSLNKKWIMTSSMDGKAKVWDIETWALVATMSPPGQAAIRCCRFSQNSALAVLSGDDDMAHIFDLNSSFAYLKGLSGHEATVFMASFSHDSSHLITGDNDGVIYVWSLKDQQPVNRVDDAHDLGISCGDCMPSNEGHYSIFVTGGNDSLLKVWKLFTRGKSMGVMDTIKILSGHGGSIMSVRFSKNGKLFTTTSGDKTCRIWHGANYTCLRLLEGHDRYVNSSCFSPSGEILVTGSNDRSFNVWRLSGPLSQVPSWTADSRQALASAPPAEEESGFSSISCEQLASAFGLTKAEMQKMVSSKGALIQRISQEVPEEFLCPITQDVMKYPVLCSDGFIYEKAAIEEWLLSRRKTSPMTNLPMKNGNMTLQKDLCERIAIFCRDHMK